MGPAHPNTQDDNQCVNHLLLDAVTTSGLSTGASKETQEWKNNQPFASEFIMHSHPATWMLLKSLGIFDVRIQIKIHSFREHRCP